MNKKFSTLMASLLLASAFSTSALAAITPVTLDKVKSGENVGLVVGSTGIKIADGELAPAQQSASVKLTNLHSATATDVATKFDQLNQVTWAVEVVKNASAAGVQNTYRIYNKYSGEYIAFKLKTDGTTTGGTKLDQTGNKTWAQASDNTKTLYAYDASVDSTFYINSSYNLVAVKGVKTSGFSGGAAFEAEDLTETPATLTAPIFNFIMSKNDGKLHFNGNKDVSSNETNILKDTKWTAVVFDAANNSFALTNGATVKGYTNGMATDTDSKYIQIDKKQYLIVDTLYQDKSAKNYFKLAVDTIPYEAYDAVTGSYAAGVFTGAAKGAVKRNSKQAEFTGTYTFTNDSIALCAVNVPKEPTGLDIFFNNAQVNVAGVALNGTFPGDANNNAPSAGQVALRQLGNGVVLTVAGKNDEAQNGWIVPMIQPYATAASAGDAEIDTDAVVYSLQVATEQDKLKSSLQGQYLYRDDVNNAWETTDVIDGANVYAQFAFIEGAAGTYRIVNRATKEVFYTGPVSVYKDENGKKVADTYVIGKNVLKIAKVDLSKANIVKEGKKEYDYSGAYYAGDATGLSQAFCLNAVSPFMSALAMQYTIHNGDTTLILGDAEDAPVWQLEPAADAATYGLSIAGIPDLKKATYHIFTQDAEDNKYYVVAKSGSDMFLKNATGLAAANITAFEFQTAAEGQYVVVGTTGAVKTKMTINPTPAKPQLEATALTSQRTDLFTINKAEAGIYRTLTEEDGVLGNAAIYMENEPSRYLYENTQNIVANNGNGVAKDSLNFLGIFNEFELEKNPTVYVDTVWVNREGNWMPQYMFGLNVQEVEATEGVPCSYTHNHYDNAGNKVDAAHCSHAIAPTTGYKTGRYLMSLTDSVPANVKNTPIKYDGNVRLAFIDATIYPGQDSIIVNNSKYTGTKDAKNDTLKVADQALNAATFALLIKDQETKSFYLETVKKGTKAQYVRILNGVPVLTDDKENAAVFNITTSELEATANEAITAESGVQVIGGQGVVTVQGAAGKVVTVANILGQTIANQVAASDNVTIAVPAGIVVVAVDGEATKVVVK